MQATHTTEEIRALIREELMIIEHEKDVQRTRAWQERIRQNEEFQESMKYTLGDQIRAGLYITSFIAAVCAVSWIYVELGIKG